MENFLDYARYYDHLYPDKDYKSETGYVDSLIRRYSRGDAKRLLEVGCGTGGHAFWFAKKGYDVTGIDKSDGMVAIARKRLAGTKGAGFSVQDAASFTLNKKFDTAVSLFHVMSYLTANELFIKSLRNIHRHLKKGGLFIFDFWYGPAVLAQRPELRIKNLADNEFLLKRTATPRINLHEDIVDIHYALSIRDKKGRAVQEISEHHVMRYFFLPELYLMLEISGFKVIKFLKWMSFKEGVSEKTWSGLIIAEKHSAGLMR